MGGTVGGDRIVSFVNTVLDRSGDSALDSTEASGAQLAKLLGKIEDPKLTSAKTSDVNLGGLLKPEHLNNLFRYDVNLTAQSFTDVFKSADGKYMEFSGYSAQHIAKKLGLTVKDCMITPDVFKKGVIDFLEGNNSSPSVTYNIPRVHGDEIADRFTQSNYRTTLVSHVDAELELDFDKQQILGKATYKIVKLGGNKLVLDTESIEVLAAWVVAPNSGSVKTTGLQKTSFRLGQTDPNKGTPLEIELPPGTKEVVVKYKTKTKTDERAPGLAWLPPSQTYSGKRPFLFTQGQPTHNRGWIPLQDTPQAKITFNGKVRVKSELGLNVVMSSDKKLTGGLPKPEVDGAYDVWNFSIRNRIPSYTLGLAAGELKVAKIAEQSYLYAEPYIFDKAMRDFTNTYRDFVTAAEGLFGANPVGVVNTVVMPPSFPYGGMENACVNFDSNTVIAGDGSNMDIAAHELIHSWFGNSITMATMADFWLHESLTVYPERVITEEVLGLDTSMMNAALGQEEIKGHFTTVGEANLTCLAGEVPLENPDDALLAKVSVLYEKGYRFAKWLEGRFGGKEPFCHFLKIFLDRNKYGVVSTEDFIDYALEHRPVDAKFTRGELVEKLYGLGDYDDAPVFVSALIESVDKALVEAEKGSVPGAENWTPKQWDYYLTKLFNNGSAPKKLLDELRAKYKLDETKNLVVGAGWYRVVAQNKYKPSYNGMRRLMDGSLGRAKYLRNVFNALVNAGEKDFALELYAPLRPKLHPITVGMLDKIMGYKKS